MILYPALDTKGMEVCTAGTCAGNSSGQPLLPRVYTSLHWEPAEICLVLLLFCFSVEGPTS